MPSHYTYKCVYVCLSFWFKEAQDPPHLLGFPRKTYRLSIHLLGAKRKRDRQHVSKSICRSSNALLFCEANTKVLLGPAEKNQKNVAMFLLREVHWRLSAQGFYRGTGRVGTLCLVTTNVLGSWKPVSFQHKSRCLYTQPVRSKPPLSVRGCREYS